MKIGRKKTTHGVRHLFYACFEDLGQEAAWTVHVREVVNNWEKLGVGVTLFAPRIWPFTTPPSCAVVYVPTIDVRYLREYVYLLILPFYILGRGLKLRPAAVYCREMSLIAPIVCISRLLGAPVVMEINGLVLSEMRLCGSHPLKIALRRLLQLVNHRLVDAIVLVLASLRETLLKEYRVDPGTMYVVPNGVDTDSFRPGDRAAAVRALGLDPKKRYVTFVGSFYPHAATPLIVRSAPLVLDRIRDARFLMIGEGMERPVCEETARALDVSSEVLFLGPRPHTEIPRYIAASDLLINVRRFYEGGSMKMLEYMSCGGTVISNFRKLYGEPLSHGDDYYYLDDPTPAGLAGAIIALLSDEPARSKIGRGARKLILDRFSWERTAEKLLSVIDAVRKKG